jgi:RNA polymerase sigma-70 factor (ECF subfamily)
MEAEHRWAGGTNKEAAVDRRLTVKKTCNRRAPVQVAVSHESRDFDAFCRLHSAELRRLAEGMTRNRADADDLVQETFVRAFRAFDRFRPGTNGMGWLVTILKRVFIDRYRRSRSFPRSDRDPGDLPLAVPESEPEPWWLSLTLTDIEEAAAELPEQAREIFESAALMGQSYAEIASRTGMDSSTVGTSLHRSRAKLRTLLTRRRPAGGPSAEDCTPARTRRPRTTRGRGVAHRQDSCRGGGGAVDPGRTHSCRG